MKKGEKNGTQSPPPKMQFENQTVTRNYLSQLKPPSPVHLTPVTCGLWLVVIHTGMENCVLGLLMYLQLFFKCLLRQDVHLLAMQF